MLKSGILSGATSMTKTEIKSLIARTEQTYGLPAGVLDRLVALESSYIPTAYNSKSGASGLTQIIKRYHPAVNNPFDPYEALEYTGRTLRQYFNEFGHWESAVAAWHSGETAVRKALSRGKLVPGTVDRYTGLPTSDYARRILSQVDTTGSANGTGVTSELFGFPTWAVVGVAALLAVVVLADD